MVTKTGFLLKQVSQNFRLQSHSRGHRKAKKEQRIGSKKGPKHKIAYYEAKWDFQVPKIDSWLVKVVFYLNKLARILDLS